MRKTSLSLAAASAALLAAASGMSVAHIDNVRTIRAMSDAGTVTQHPGGQSKKAGTKSSDFARGAWLRLRGTRRRRSAYGWTNAHQKRVALKARNVKRNRRK